MKNPNTNTQTMIKGFEAVIRDPSTEEGIRHAMLVTLTMAIGFKYIEERDPKLAEDARAYATKNFLTHRSVKDFREVLHHAAHKSDWVKEMLSCAQFMMIAYEHLYAVNPDLTDEARTYAFENHGLEGVTVIDVNEGNSNNTQFRAGDGE